MRILFIKILMKYEKILEMEICLLVVLHVYDEEFFMD